MRVSRHMLLGMLGPPVGPGIATAVMALGDSITLGSPAHTSGGESYRAAAKAYCDQYGYPVTWVGPEKHASQTYFHNGVSGHYIHEIEDEVDAHIDDYLAEVIVVCGGANDVMLGTATGEPANMAAAMEQLIDTINVLPGTKHVVLTDIPVQDDETADCIAYNALLETLAGTYENVTWAPIFAGVELGDGVHPTAAGYIAAGEALGPILYTVLANLPAGDVGRSVADLSGRQRFASTAIRDFWADVYNEAGDGLGPMFEDASNTDPVEDGDDINSITDLLNSGDFNELVNAPVYDADGGPGGQPVMVFTGAAGATGMRKSTHTFGSPCSLWWVGELYADTVGYLFTRGVGGGAIVMVQSETSGAGEDGIGFYNPTDGHVSFAGDDGSTHTDDFALWAVVFGDDNFARLYRNGVQQGEARAYTTFAPASSNLDIGYLQTPQWIASAWGGFMRALSEAELAALTTWATARYDLEAA